MNKEINNPKQPITPEIRVFNDRDILEDSLDSLKHLGTQVGTLATEASNKSLLTTIEGVEKSVKKLARDSFDLMFKLGWYTLYEEEKQQIDKTYQQFLNYYNEQLGQN